MAAIDPAARRCWAVDCGHGTETIATDSGMCGCQPVTVGGAPSTALQSLCAQLDCPEGSRPSVAGAGCRCESLTGVDWIGSGGIVPRGQFAITDAPVFREVHVT